MSDIAIRVEGLGKLYRIGKRERYRALRDTLTDAMYAPFRQLRSAFRTSAPPQSANGDDSIWALKDVSFEIPRGEVVGVIGRNGAGKSTLLKILSRITEPTGGQVEIHGRVGSLLEVGTGFHPELTGRENIFLNGAILGMRRTEIVRKFDEIVAFAEIEKFIDTPVKHYSTGMYMRLAFAVAAHLEPEILIVDEVLAVGDLTFQKKCLGKMGDVAKDGRTIIFVSHQMNQIRRLCTECIWLDEGEVRSTGSTPMIVGAYEAAGPRQASPPNRPRAGRAGGYFTGWEVADSGTRELNIICGPGPVCIKFTFDASRALQGCFHGIALYNSQDQLIWANGVSHFDLSPGRYEFRYTLDIVPLQPGLYRWLATIYDEAGLVDQWDCTPELVVGTEPLNHARDDWSGILNIPWNFSIHRGSEQRYLRGVETVASPVSHS